MVKAAVQNPFHESVEAIADYRFFVPKPPGAEPGDISKPQEMLIAISQL